MPRGASLEAGAFQLGDILFPERLVLPEHEHERPIFAVFLDGSMEVEFASRGFDCRPGTVQIHPAGERHRQRYHQAGARIVVIEPDPARLAPLGRASARLLSEIGHFRHGGLVDLARRLAHELRHPDSVTPLAAEGLALEMLACAARLDERHRMAGAAPPWLERAREMIHARFLDGLRIVDVAEVAGVHPTHLARTFREHFHEPIGGYIRRLRLDWAAGRLLVTREPISRIALRAGFCDQSHFTRAFRRYSGQTPARYRRNRSRRGR